MSGPAELGASESVPYATTTYGCERSELFTGVSRSVAVWPPELNSTAGFCALCEPDVLSDTPVYIDGCSASV